RVRHNRHPLYCPTRRLPISVKKGDTLLIIDQREYTIQQKQTEAALLNAKAQLAVWQTKVQTLSKTAKVNHSKINVAKANLQKEKDRKSTRLNSSHVKISYAV